MTFNSLGLHALLAKQKQEIADLEVRNAALCNEFSRSGKRFLAISCGEQPVQVDDMPTTKRQKKSATQGNGGYLICLLPGKDENGYCPFIEPRDSHNHKSSHCPAYHNISKEQYQADKCFKYVDLRKEEFEEKKKIWVAYSKKYGPKSKNDN